MAFSPFYFTTSDLPLDSFCVHAEDLARTNEDGTRETEGEVINRLALKAGMHGQDPFELVSELEEDIQCPLAHY